MATLIPEIEEEEEAEEETSRSRMDPELRAIQQMLRILDKIPEAGRRDVVEYMTRRFNRESPKA